MKKLSVAVLIFIVSFGLFYAVFASAPQKDKIQGFLNSSSPDRQCFNYHKSSLNDPDSAYLISSRIWSQEDEKNINFKLEPLLKKYKSIVIVEIRAKNRMGAYVPLNIKCPLIDGKFDETYALIESRAAFE